MDSNRDFLRQLNDQLNDELEAEKRHDALRRVRLYRWARRHILHAADFGRDMVSDYWITILAAIFWFAFVGVAEGSARLAFFGPVGILVVVATYTWYDRKLRTAYDLCIRLREEIHALEESGRDLEYTIRSMILAKGKNAAVGDAPGVWIGDTWYEVEVEES